jgi:23S rRNA-/tRNA-specific pseudouridylate synthase
MPDFESIETLWDGEIALAVLKPAGLSTQAPGSADSLELRLRSQLKDRSDYLAFPHRLDRAVGGVILVALRKRAARLLSEQFRGRKVRKSYLARVAGRIDSVRSPWIDALRKVPDQARVEITDPADPGSKRAETEVELLRFDDCSETTWLRLWPVTGRMHQLRVQAANRGFPIVGDRLYGGPPLPDLDDRIELQAESIRFFDPRDARETLATIPNAASIFEK